MPVLVLDHSQTHSKFEKLETGSGAGDNLDKLVHKKIVSSFQKLNSNSLKDLKQQQKQIIKTKQNKIEWKKKRLQETMRLAPSPEVRINSDSCLQHIQSAL